MKKKVLSVAAGICGVAVLVFVVFMMLSGLDRSNPNDSMPRESYSENTKIMNDLHVCALSVRDNLPEIIL